MGRLPRLIGKYWQYDKYLPGIPFPYTNNATRQTMTPISIVEREQRLKRCYSHLDHIDVPLGMRMMMHHTFPKRKAGLPLKVYPLSAIKLDLCSLLVQVLIKPILHLFLSKAERNVHYPV